MMRSSLFECEDSISKSVEVNGWSCCCECSRIAEKAGLPRDIPVRMDLPLCSKMRCFNQREVDPTYLE